MVDGRLREASSSRGNWARLGRGGLTYLEKMTIVGGGAWADLRVFSCILGNTQLFCTPLSIYVYILIYTCV